MIKRMLAAAMLAVALVGCSSGTTATSAPSMVATPTPSTATPTPSVEPSVAPSVEPSPSPEPSAAQTLYKVGQPVTVQQDGADWAVITVDSAKTATSYKGQYYNDKPDKGNVYLAVHVTYKALANGVDYNPYDWQVFVDDVAVDNTAIVMNGPTPELSSGTLPKGRSAAGYIVYEVPTTGRVVMSYASNIFTNDAPIFEVEVRP